GPQAGIIAGRRKYLESIKRHPLLRAMRIDKLTLAALEATLRLYRDPRQAMAAIPTLRMLASSPEELSRRADALMRRLRPKLPSTVTLGKHKGESSPGGGSYPLLQLPTTLIEVGIAGSSPQQIEEALRNSTPPVLGRINRDRFLLDIRTIHDSEFPFLAEALLQAADTLSKGSL
ncbi:MAG: L-seryl-tRNA(Sec) selenium transferase, partial [Deltaproteobacteria bacterium]